MFIAALFTIATNQNQLRWLYLTNNENMLHIYTVEYHPFVRKKILQVNGYVEKMYWIILPRIQKKKALHSFFYKDPNFTSSIMCLTWSTCGN